MTRPQRATTPASLANALRELAATERLLVALDFDGTLAPEVDDPEQARILPEARAAMLRLAAAPRTRVALVSGRAMASLEQVARQPEQILLVGSHGVELKLDTPDTRLSLGTVERARVEELGAMLRDTAASFAEVWVESKPAGFALHTRRATDADARSAQRLALQRIQAELPGLTVRHGKNVLEFSVLGTTKGEAIELLREHTRATATFYAGDDVTDEDAFAALADGDLGLKVGQGPSSADFRVASPQEVGAVLDELARLREASALS